MQTISHILPHPGRAAKRAERLLKRAGNSAVQSAEIFFRDVGHGLLEVSHNTLALLGLLIAATLVFAASHSDIRHLAEARALGWLQAREEARSEPPALPDSADAVEPGEPDAIARATATDPKELNRQQAAVAQWLSRRYRVAPEPVSRLVQEAWHVGARARLDPTLILAIMAVESSFNPFAQSAVGAQGLMQVMTKVHNEKYEAFGGNHAAFDPVTNLRVGVQVLKECIARAGSLEAGLRFYVGAANLTDDGGYAGKVLSEQNSLRQVAGGKSVPTTHSVPMNVAAPTARGNSATPQRAEAESVAPTPAASPEAAHGPEQIAFLR
jgi:Transglycosylase SLT domain